MLPNAKHFETKIRRKKGHNAVMLVKKGFSDGVQKGDLIKSISNQQYCHSQKKFTFL